MLAAAAVGPNSPSVTPSPDQYKLLLKMVQVNSQLLWSDNQEAHKFISGLEGILVCSPILQTHWISFMYMMVPGKYELEQQWIRDNIVTPLLSWNAAKVAFTAHFQHSDYMDGLRYLYNDCHQSVHESIQEYSRRFQTLVIKLGYGDNDIQSIYHYINGLQETIQHKMALHKSQMRTIPVGSGIPNPNWDFSSLSTTIQLAITIGIDPIYYQSTPSTTPVPFHLQHSVLANPVCAQIQLASTPAVINENDTAPKKRKMETMKQVQGVGPSISKATAETKCYRCEKYGHFAYECPAKIKRVKRTDSFHPTN